MDLNGKVAIVTGAAHGIGAEFAAALAAAGAKVVVADVLDGSAVVSRIGAAGGEGRHLAPPTAPGVFGSIPARPPQVAGYPVAVRALK